MSCAEGEFWESSNDQHGDTILLHNPCFGHKRLAVFCRDHVAFNNHLLLRRRILFVNNVVVAVKFRNVLSFVANWRPLSCRRQHSSLRTHCLCRCCNNYAFERHFILILSLSSFPCCSWDPKIKYADEEDVCLLLD